MQTCACKILKLCVLLLAAVLLLYSVVSTGLSTVQTVGISVIISSIVSFTAGLLVALVIAYCYIRQQKTNQYSPNEPKQPAPMYEDVSMDVRRDIELKENVAYRVVGQ